MEIKFIRGIESSGNNVWEFTSSYGRGLAQYRGREFVLGETLSVEFECPAQLQLGFNVVVSTSHAPAISHDGALTSFTAQVEESEASGAAVLRLGESLILVDVDKNFPLQGDWVTVYLNNLCLFNTNV